MMVLVPVRVIKSYAHKLVPMLYYHDKTQVQMFNFLNKHHFFPYKTQAYLYLFHTKGQCELSMSQAIFLKESNIVFVWPPQGCCNEAAIWSVE